MSHYDTRMPAASQATRDQSNIETIDRRKPWPHIPLVAPFIYGTARPLGTADGAATTSSTN